MKEILFYGKIPVLRMMSSATMQPRFLVGLKNREILKMEWMEINCIIDGLVALIDKYNSVIKDESSSEDDRADIANDLAYAEILHGKYVEMRDKMR